jgi:hypothetical protein
MARGGENAVRKAVAQSVTGSKPNGNKLTSWNAD